MPFNILRFGSPRPRDIHVEEGGNNGHPGGGGFFQRNFRRGRPSDDGAPRDPSFRRQALLRGMSMRRGNSEDSEMVLPVLPPRPRGSEHDNSSDTTDTFDGESYVEIPIDVQSPTDHAPSFRGGSHPPEAGHVPHGSSYEPSIHHFGAPPSTEDTYSDVAGSPIPHRARGIDDPRNYGPGVNRSRGMGSSRGNARGRPRDFDSPLSSNGYREPYHPHEVGSSGSSDSHDMVIPPELHSSAGRREFDSPASSAGRREMQRSRGIDSQDGFQGRHRERGIENPRYPGGYAGRDMDHGPLQLVPSSSRSETTEGSHDGELEGRLHPAFREASQGSHSSRSSGSRVMPPEPQVRSRGMGGSHSQGSAPPIRERAMPMDRGDRGSHRRGYSEPQHHAPEPDTYYIIPPGTNVIFQDEDGNEIHRVGDFTGKKRHYKEQPIVVQDEFGREIYRTPGYGEPRDNISYMDHYGNTPNIILMDRQGRQIPISQSGSSTASRSEPYEGSDRSGSSGTVNGSRRHRS